MPTPTGHLAEVLQSVEDWLVSSTTWKATFNNSEARNLVHWAANEEALRDDLPLDRPYAVIAIATHRYFQVSQGACSGLLAHGDISIYLTRNATYQDNMKDSYTDFLNWAGSITADMVETTPPHIIGLELALLQRVMPHQREDVEFDFWELEYKASF